MKKPFVILAFFFLWIFSCKTKEDIEPTTQTNLVGKWTATGRMQSQNEDNTWGNWYVLQTFAAVPVSIWEFTSDGRFLRDGNPGASCCFAGDRYTTKGNELIFSEFENNCANLRCVPCNDWDFSFTDNDTLVLRQCTSKYEFKRVK